MPDLSIEYPGTRHLNKDAPQGSKFEINFKLSTELAASFTLNGKTLTYTSDTFGIFTIDIVNMKMGNNYDPGVFKNLSGDIDTFLTLNPGLNTLVYSGTTDVYVSYTPLYY